MTSLDPRPPYSKDELGRLYPEHLQLQLVQILLRHGERSPVSARFQNAGLPPHWPYCRAAKRLSSVVMTNKGSTDWDDLQWRRRLETFGEDDGPIIASGPSGEVDAVCQLGELTDQGRETTLALGQRLRHLYVDRLGFMPKLIADADMIYLRATPMPRALDSVQQSFWGLYPPSARTASFPPPTILTRTPADETLFPNDSNCRRFSQLSRAFAQRTADRWNETTEMEYLNKLMSRWMPPTSHRIAVDSHPRLSGIMDTINATLAHGPKTRLPSEFYDPKGREIIDRIGTEEWFSGYKESTEYRSLGIGSLVGDVVSRMIGSVERNGNDGLMEIGGEDGALGKGRGGESEIKFALSACHDTTLGAILASLGAFEGENGKWPPFTSHIAVELFRNTEWADGKTVTGRTSFTEEKRSRANDEDRKSLWASLFGGITSDPVVEGRNLPKPEGMARKTMIELNDQERSKLRGYYVRLRYNDRPVVVSGCKAPGNHLAGDESFCTLDAFKSIVDKFTPKNWKQACAANTDKPAFPATFEPPGI
ncbi:MAG: hypothetical protein M1827_006102 [Pycnora praestabilis]|nr:MAG: hypothetical protein M1827_006102 [Pycnora praestabilis]